MFPAPLKYLSLSKCNWCICLEFIAFSSTAAEGINGKGGNIKDTSLSGLAPTDLLRTARVCTVVEALV